MKSLREEIAKLLWQIYIQNEYGIEEYKDEYEYEYGVHNWTQYSEQDKKGYLEEADEILKLIEKKIDTISKPYMKYYAVPDLVIELKEEMLKK
jgi:hypothetical protein